MLSEIHSKTFLLAPVILHVVHAAKNSCIEKWIKLNVIVVPVRSYCWTACNSPKPLIAPGMAAISQQACFISSSVKISLLSLRASRDNFESCFTTVAQGSGRLVRSVIVLSREWPARYQQIVRQIKWLYTWVEFFWKEDSLIIQVNQDYHVNTVRIKHKPLTVRLTSRYLVSSPTFCGGSCSMYNLWSSSAKPNMPTMIVA